MSFKDLLDQLMKGNLESEELVEGSLISFSNFLNEQAEIRFYIDNTPNFGHQATTIHVMKRLIDRFQYKNKITIIYSPSDKKGKSIPAKLALLLEGLNPEEIETAKIQYGTCNNISFLNFEKMEDLKPLKFGCTGGADDTSVNYAEKLKVSFFLRLQPYLWKVASRIETEGEIIDIEKLSPHFPMLAYKYDLNKVNTVPDKVWKWYCFDQKFDVPLSLRTLNARAIIENTNIRNPRLWPIYGLHQYNAEEVLFNLSLQALEFQSSVNIPEFKRPIIITLINSTTADDYKKWTNYIQLFKEGCDEIQKKLMEDYDSTFGASTIPSLQSFADCIVQIRKKLELNSPIPIGERIKILPHNFSYADLNVAVTNLGNNQLLIIPLGSVPQDIFNLFYAKAEMPGFFEGQGTSSLAINIGKPFFQASTSSVINECNYPSILLIADDNEESQNTYIDHSCKLLVESFNAYIEKSKIKPEYYKTEVLVWVALFLGLTYDPNDDYITKYFKGISSFYQQEVHDKLMLGIAALDFVCRSFKAETISQITSSFSGLEQAGDDSLTLEAVYNNLLNNWQDGRINLIASLRETNNSNFYKAIVGDTFLITTLKEDITFEKRDDDIIQVNINNASTNAFGVNFDLKLVYSYKDKTNKVTSNLVCYRNDTWILEEVPWIGFENPGFAMQVTEGGIPVEGKAFGKIKGTDLNISIDYPVQDNQWVITGEFDKPELNFASFYQIAGGINLIQSLPSPLNSISGFGLTKTQFVYDTNNRRISYILFILQSENPWVFLDTPLFQIKPRIKFVIYNPGDLNSRSYLVKISGEFTLGTGTVTILAQYPDFQLAAELTEGEIGLSDLVELFGAEIDLHSAVTEFNMVLQPSTKDYIINTTIVADWPITILGKTVFTITGLGFNVNGIGEKYIVTLSGTILILPDSEKIGIGLTATYATSSGWTFISKQISGQISLLTLFSFYLPADWKPEPTQFDILIDDLSTKIETKADSWEFTGKTAMPIAIPGTGININLNLKMGYNGGTSTMGGRETLIGVAEVPALAFEGQIVPLTHLLLEDTPEVGYFGTASAEITWEFIDITVFYDFKPGYKAFGIKWGILEGQITQENNKTIAILNFTQSTTLGSMVEVMVSWATGSKFSLASPWNILDSIPLNNFSLKYNFTDKQVSFDVHIGPIELGFAHIDSINIAYKSNQPNPDDNGVMVELVGQFRWQDDPNKPLGWDASKPETTPAPEGQGNKYLDLRLLALGQHVTLPCLAEANTVQDAIACMKQLPEPDKDNIMVPPVTLDANSSWLIGMEFGILRFGGDKKQNGSGGDTADSTALVSLVQDEAAASGYFITMQIVFNDPNLYALRIALDGDAAKVLKGLDFQILYKKIGDNLGLYKAEIALPDKMRFIRMGQYNINLPVFGIEYYTNGDFQVDFGFPWKADFSRSLTFQTLIWTPVPIPVMGSLGVYFGKLSSATTNKVPKIDNGTFNPVLVFGFGIQFGLGYTFEVGILKAGFSLTAVAILEGVIAKFNAYQLTDGSGNIDQVDSSYYFWIKGTVGIIGKLFGSVDFAIIKADVNIDIRILASFTFAPYEPIELNLMASVDIEVSIKINLGLFKIKISFSFSAKISQTITIKAIGDNSPWHIAPGEAAFFMALRRKRKRGFPERQMLLAIAASTPLNWRNLKPSEPPAKLQGYMTLGLTMAGDTATQLSEQVACYVAMMFIDSVAPPREDPTGGIAKAYSDSADTSFEILAKTILRWAVAALQPAPVTPQEVDLKVVTDIQLQHLLNALKNPDQPTPIPSADIKNFMTGQFNFRVEGPTSSKEPNATYFPVPPSMKLSLPQYGSDYDASSYTFGEYNKTSSDYLAYLRDYFNQLAVKVQEENNNTVSTFALNDSNSESLSSFIFSDYFLMICRQMLQSALDSLREFKYFLQDGNTPNDIVKWINTNAALSGDSTYSLEELFTDNAGVALNADKSLVIQGVTYVVQANDTFDSIAANSFFSSGFDGVALATLNADTNNTLRAGIALNYPGKPPYTTQPGQSLKNVAEAIGGIDVAGLIQNGGITSLPNLPLPVATYKIPDFTYKTVDGDTLRSVAAKFRIDQKHLAAPDANGEVIDLLFKSSTNPTTLDIANLTQFKVGELLKEIQASQGLQHLSGMVSRYYLAGLRLPTNGITPEKKGMWVTGDSPDNYKLPDFAGLYALTGQQFPIPNLNITDDFNVNFENGGLAWLNFANEEPTKLEISIKPNTNDAAQINLVKGFATTTKLDTGLTYLGLGGMFNTKEATYTFNNEIVWSAVSSFNMPYGGKPPGIPTMQLWRLPDPLLDLPDPSTRKVNPRMAMKVGEYSEAAGAMVERGLNYYGYASLIEFTVKKVPAIEASPSTKTTYEIIGADGSSAKVLERIVSEIGNNDEAIQILILAYATDPNGTTSQGIQTDNASSVTLGLVQVNLSTETRPDSALSAEMLLTESGAEDMTLLNTKTDFIRLLWEASITRAGGYFLYYFNQDTPGGLPDRVFNDKQEALLSLIVVYSQPTNTTLQNTIGNYMNALVTGEAIERSNTVLFAESNPNPNLTIPSTATQTLAEIAYRYFGNVSQVAADNADLVLRPGIELVVSEGTYVVGPDAPGGDLQAISTYFGTTQEAIKSANPKIATWANTLAQYTVLYLPLLTLKIGINQGGNTLGGHAKYYGMNLTALANRNKDVTGIFADGQAVKISGGPAITTSTVPAGNVTVEAIRPVPLALPDTPTGNDYGKIFLLNMYSLLSYQVTGNLYFKESQLGLPASPTAKPEDSNNFSKIRVPQMLAEGDDWLFRLAVPYNQFSLQTLSTQSNLPDPNNSPYKGLGDLLQVDFAWQDLYGNRLLTNLSNPSANDKTPLNKSPILTGYNDAIIGLKQWPSVTSTYEVVNHTGKPTINLSLTFDGSVYQGLISAEVKSANTIHAVFTEALDQISAVTTNNYTLDNGIKIQSVVLNADNLTVVLTVDQIPPSVELALSVANISNAGKTQTFQGLAKFYNRPTVGESTSTLLQKAKGDLQTFTQIWYQMTDPYGIRYTVTTSLVESDYILDSTQVSGLVQTWLASIWRFVNDRACGHTAVPLPATSHLLSFPIGEANLNRKEIYKLNLSFTIERTGGAVIGDLETTSGIKSVSTDITPYAGAANKTTSSLKIFAQNFETALEKTGVYALKIATGIDRKESLSSKGGNELWVVRLGLDQQTSIAYQIDKKDPLLFAPRPVSTKLENRDRVDIYDFDPSKGIDFNTPSRHLNFTNIDMDLWTEQFFSAVDGMLSPEFTAAIELVDHYQNKTCLQTMLNNKKALAGIVKEWMIFVFDSENGSTSEIQEAFYQQLLVKLSNAYTVKAGVQYSAKVEAGDFKLFFVSLGDDNNLVLLFTSDIDQNTAENTKNYSISGGLVVSSATFNAQNAQIVTLKIGGGVPVVGETLVTIASGYQDAQGITIAGSLIMRVQSGSAATPELYGNIALKQTVETVVDVSYQTRNLSITSAKLNLKNSKAVPLPFLISAPQLVRNDAGAILPYIDLDTTYVSNEIEQQIEALPNIPGYRASTWLSFLNGSNLLNADLGVTKVPMILRSFPASPMMVKQQGEASNPISVMILAKILEWNYTINYSQTFHYPQDELNFTVNFNVYDDATVLANFKDVFNTLAEFITVYPEVEKVFREKLVGIDATTADQDKFNAAAIALDAFNGMVDKIVAVAKITGLHASNFSPSRLTLAVDPYNFSVKEGSGTVGTETAALLVTIIGKPPAGIGTPTVTISGYTTKTYTGTCNGDFCFYFQDPGGNPLKALTGQGIGSRTVTLPKMNILARQDAETTVELKRNIDLVPSKTTASDFIYTTGKVGFANRYYPLIEYDQEFSIAAIGSGEPQNATLSQHLTNLFNELLKENSQDTLSFLMANTYTYQLNPALDRIELPGIMQPMQSFNVKGSSGRDDDKTLKKIIDIWSGSIQKWFSTHKTSIEDGILHFDLTIFSNLTQQPLPLVRLKSLTLELKYVIDIPQKIVTIEQQDSIYCGKWLFIYRPLKLWQYFKWAKWGENNALWFAIQSPYMTIVFAKGDIGDPLIFFYPFPH